MADNKFKTAAAKLLAQHAAKQANRPLPEPMKDPIPVPEQPPRIEAIPVPEPPPRVETIPVPEPPPVQQTIPVPQQLPKIDPIPVPAQSPRNPDLLWQEEKHVARPHGFEPAVTETTSYAPSAPFSLYKISMVLLHAVIGCGLMFELVAPIPVIGIAGNIAIGLVVGTLVGFVVANKL